MTREEVIKLLMMIQAAYPNYKPQDKTIAVNMWHEMLKDYDSNTVMASFKAYVASDQSGFAPSIGQLLGRLNSAINECTEVGDLEAWSLVSKAIRNGYYGAEVEFEKLPPLVQKAVGSPYNIRNWATTDLKSVETVIMSQFLSSYKALQKREKEVNGIMDQIESMEKERKMING
jgi:hypothetical protein